MAEKRGFLLILGIVIFMIFIATFVYLKSTGFVNYGINDGPYGTMTCWSACSTDGKSTSTTVDKTTSDPEDCPAGSFSASPTCTLRCWGCNYDTGQIVDVSVDGPANSVSCSSATPPSGCPADVTFGLNPPTGCYPACYYCENGEVKKTTDLPSCTKPKYSSSSTINCTNDKTCSKCTSSGSLDKLYHQSSCPSDYSEGILSSCTITCQRCDGKDGQIKSTTVTGPPSGSGASNQVTCPQDLSSSSQYTTYVLAPDTRSCYPACYYCPSSPGSNLPPVTLYNKETCGQQSTQENQNIPGFRSFDYCNTCYKCGSPGATNIGLQITTGPASTTQCSSPWLSARPANCGKCYSCVDGKLKESIMPADTGYTSCEQNMLPRGTWQSSPPSDCNKKSCYKCKPDGTVDSKLVDSSASCDTGYTDQMPSTCSTDCQTCDGTSGNAKVITVNLDPSKGETCLDKGYSSSTPDVCPIKCNKCGNNGENIEATTTIHLSAGDTKEAACGLMGNGFGPDIPNTCSRLCYYKDTHGEPIVKRCPAGGGTPPILCNFANCGPAELSSTWQPVTS